jgi:DNA-binding CsgD family transcriptional regulator
MARLSEVEYRAALAVLYEAGKVEGSVPFPAPVLTALRRLVPCDVVAYHERTRTGRILVWVGEPRGEVTDAVREAASRLAPTDVLVPAEGARKYSDYLTRREYHRRPIYNEVARPLGVEDMFRLWIFGDGERGARIEFDRPDWRFRENDRAKLNLLLPHLRQFCRAAEQRRVAEGDAAGLTPREREIVSHVAEGRTNRDIATRLLISPDTVRKHLENAYEKLGVHTRTGAVAALQRLTTDSGSDGASTREPHRIAIRP